MKKIIIVTSIIVLIIIEVLSGCQIQECPSPSENKPIAVGCILQHPDRYLNKSVTIKGVYGGNSNFNASWGPTPSIDYANVPDSLNLIFLEKVITSVLIPTKDYYFAGVVKEYKNEGGLHRVYLEVSKIEST